VGTPQSLMDSLQLSFTISSNLYLRHWSHRTNNGFFKLWKHCYSITHAYFHKA